MTEDPPSTMHRGPAFLGLLVSSGAAATLALRGQPLLEGFAGTSALGLLIVAAGAVVGVLAVLRASPRWGFAAAGILLLAPTPYRLGLPGLLEWGLAIAGVLGLAMFLQPILVAREGESLRERLTTRDDAEARDRDVDALVEATVDRRLSRSRRTLLVAGGVLVGAVVATRVVGVLLPARFADSLELRSLYGTVLLVVLVLSGLLAVAVARRLRGGSSGEDPSA